MAKYEEYLKAIAANLEDFAKDEVSEYRDSAQADGDAFVEALRTNLKKWTTQLSKGELTKDEFKFLVEGQSDLLELRALKQSGLALVKIETIRDGIIGVVIDTAFDLF